MHAQLISEAIQLTDKPLPLLAAQVVAFVLQKLNRTQLVCQRCHHAGSPETSQIKSGRAFKLRKPLTASMPETRQETSLSRAIVRSALVPRHLWHLPSRRL